MHYAKHVDFILIIAFIRMLERDPNTDIGKRAKLRGCNVCFLKNG